MLLLQRLLLLLLLLLGVTATRKAPRVFEKPHKRVGRLWLRLLQFGQPIQETEAVSRRNCAYLEEAAL